MTGCDLAILEFLYNEGNRNLRATPAMMDMNIDYSSSTIRPRVRELEKRGYIEYWDEDRGAYTISEKGERYLRGELDEDEL